MDTSMDNSTAQNDLAKPLDLPIEVWCLIGESVSLSRALLKKPIPALLDNGLTDLSDTKSKYPPRAEPYMPNFLRPVYSIPLPSIRLRPDGRSPIRNAAKASTAWPSVYPEVRSLTRGVSGQQRSLAQWLFFCCCTNAEGNDQSSIISV